MNQTPKKPWYKKPFYWLAGGLFTLFIITGAASSSTSTAQPSVSQTSLEASAAAASLQAPSNLAPAPAAQTTVKKATVTIPAQPASEQLSNDNYYTNVDGNNVHSPAHAPSIPAGATAQCRDGSYSFSQHRSGTCSHHGGVASWF